MVHSRDTVLLIQRPPLPVSCKDGYGMGDEQDTGQRHVATGRATE